MLKYAEIRENQLKCIANARQKKAVIFTLPLICNLFHKSFTKIERGCEE